MPFIRSCPDSPKYGKNSYFVYSGWHQDNMNFQPSSPPLPHVATPAKVSTAKKTKIICNIEFIFVLKKLVNKLIFKKRKFSKIVLQTH
jgi:hypothetical protein